MTARAAFKQDDVTRALKGVKAAGIEAATIRLRPSGEIVIQIGVANDPDSGGGNPWDDDPE